MPPPTEPHVETSPPVADEIKTTTCYMCACRCGIKVHLKDGGIRFIQGNRDHPVNKGVLCAKGSAGALQHLSPARLSKPLKRTGPRGSGEFEEIEWDEALEIACGWLGDIRRDDPRKLAFYTGRDQSQALTGWWATQFGTPNHAAHGGFCSVNMAAAGLYTIGGAFWEFGEPDWERTKHFIMFGVAEDHDSNPIKTGLATLKERGAKFISVNPVRSGYSAIADEWLGITPGTDGLFVMALIHELLRAGKVDADYLARYTNAGWLVIENLGKPDDGMFLRNQDRQPLCLDRTSGEPASFFDPDTRPDLKGRHDLGGGRTAVPVFRLLAERYLQDKFSPDAVADTVGIPADVIRRHAAEIAAAAFEGDPVIVEQPWTDAFRRKHDRMVGRPVSMHAMRGISAHSNGFHTCRAIHLLQALIGSIDTPGGFRYKPPYPRPIPPHVKPTGRKHQLEAGSPMNGPAIGFPLGPDDLIVGPYGVPGRIDKAFSWEAPLAVHGMMHMAITNAWKRDPYPIDTLFLYMANMAWNSAMNTAETVKMLTDKDEATGEYRIPHIIYADAYASETVQYADLILPDTTYLERWDCMSLLDRPISDAEGAADSIRQPVMNPADTPGRDVRPFQDVLIDIGARLGFPGLTNDDGSAKYPGGYADYLVNHQRKPGIGSLAGWRGADGDQHGKGAPNPNQLDRYIENGCFWRHEIPEAGHYFKNVNQAYLDHAVEMGYLDNADPIVLELYSEEIQRFRRAARGHGDIQPPERDRLRVETYFDPLPIWYPPFEDIEDGDAVFPLHAVTQRPAAMYHSWGSQNAWLRQIHGWNALYINRETGAQHGLKDGDWAWVESRNGRIKAPVRLMDGVNPNTVWTWNAIGKRRGAWNLGADSPEFKQGFLLNSLIDELLPARAGGYRYSNSDPVTGQAAWYDLRVRIEKCAPEEAGEIEPIVADIKPLDGLPPTPAVLRYGKSS